MSGMMDRLVGFLLGLSRRERWLLAVLALVVLPVGLIYGVALPLTEQRAAARDAVAEARATELWVADQAVTYATLRRDAGEGRATAHATDPIGISGIEARDRKSVV